MNVENGHDYTQIYLFFVFSNMHIQRGDIHILTHTPKKKGSNNEKKRNIQLSSNFLVLIKSR